MTVAEIAPMGQPIDVTAHTTAAFVGRALRGPVNTPVLIESFSAFRRRFGGIWRQSSLGPAVLHFFEHGGMRLYVVRVANNARGAMICLPAEHGVLVLHALEPGATEKIRAAVDYDRINPADKNLFNLTIQRVAPDNGLVIDQEIYHRLSCSENSDRFIADILLTSSLVTVDAPLPPGRPMATNEGGEGTSPEYVDHAQRGSDGEELSDYDLVGSMRANSGLFALDAVDEIDLLYLPPPARDHDPGPAVVLVAEMYCRKRGAMLILDPPFQWKSAAEAVGNVHKEGYASPNIISYFPRMYSRDDEDLTPRAVGGAVAGLLCKIDAQHGPWEDLDQHGFGFNRNLAPTIKLTATDGARLVREGLNVIAGLTAGRAGFCGSVTLGRGSQMDRISSSLTVRRLCLAITSTIDHATRWAVFEPDAPQVAERIQAQIHAYMNWLDGQGAFAEPNFNVQCDAMLHSGPMDPHRGINVLLVFHPQGSDEIVSLTLHQSVSGFRVATTAFAPVFAACA